MLTGPDVSNLQGDVDMHAVKGAGHSFVGIKVSEGADFLDSCFKRNRDRARIEGLVRLLYHFSHPANGRGHPVGDPLSAVIEARWFLQCIGRLEPGEIAICDLEDSKVPARVDLTAWLQTFLKTVDDLTKRASELYSYGPYVTAHLRFRSGNQPQLWLAAYTTNPSVPPPWPSYTFHQYTSSGTCPGIAGRCDLNRFAGPLDALQTIAALTPQEDDLTPQQAQQLQEIHDLLNTLVQGAPGFGVDPVGVDVSKDHALLLKIADKLGVSP